MERKRAAHSTGQKKGRKVGQKIAEEERRCCAVSAYIEEERESGLLNDPSEQREDSDESDVGEEDLTLLPRIVRKDGGRRVEVVDPGALRVRLMARRVHGQVQRPPDSQHQNDANGQIHRTLH
jgi:hypothetical protein